MGFWSAYQASKRPPEVEELCDYIMRPLGYLVAKAAMPTPVSPNAITVMSMLFSVAAAAVWFAAGAHHALVGAALLFLGAVMDAADGQLARMRKATSDHGRMLDGVADGMCAAAAIGGGTWLVIVRYLHNPPVLALILVAAVLTAWTGSMHTSMYDHYKNVWLRFTQDRVVEGEDFATATARHESLKGQLSLLMRATWGFYFGYLKNQESLVRRFDPYTSSSVNQLPPYDDAHAAIYRRHTERVMPLWKPFGFGTVIVGLALFAAFDRLEYYMALRLLLVHPAFYFYVRPLQQRASREAFAEMGLAPGSPPAVAALPS